MHKATNNNKLDYETISILLDKKISPNKQNYSQKTSLHNVCNHLQLNLKLLEKMLKFGGDFNKIDKFKMSSLHYLFNNENLSKDMITILPSDYGVSFRNFYDSSLCLPVYYLINNKNFDFDIFSAINKNFFLDLGEINKKKKVSFLSHLIISNNFSLDILQYYFKIVEKKNHFESDSFYKKTPLHFFTEKYFSDEKNFSQIFFLLLEQKADLNSFDYNGMTPVCYLFENSYFQDPKNFFLLHKIFDDFTFFFDWKNKKFLKSIFSRVFHFSNPLLFVFLILHLHDQNINDFVKKKKIF